jgi:2'-5' RNA ligase
METATQTALIVAVPEVEEAVGPQRASLDRAASWGVPAHVTVLYPFLPPARVDDGVLATLTDTFATVPPFDVVFGHVEWFGDSVVWLAPRPDRPFRDLTAAVVRRFPETPPYEGVFGDDVVPHLTIGHDAARDVLARAGNAVAEWLPIRATVGGVRLLAGSPTADSWRTLHEFRLASA